MNTRAELEATTKKVLDNLKNVKATTVDYSYYHNGTPGKKDAAFLGFDKSEN
jgi:hypothetical protein